MAQSVRGRLSVILALVAVVFSLSCSSTDLAAQTQHTIWPNSAVPSIVDSGPDWPVELGVSFKADTAGSITGIRFYKSSANTGTHIVNLWTNTGVRLASATATGESASGWQQVNFTQSVAINANSVYVASYHVANGHWSVNWNYFAVVRLNNDPMHAFYNHSSTHDGQYT